MTDRRQLPVETTEGWRPGSSGGERILAALAAVVLVSGLLIAAGNLLPKDEVVAVASSSPGPTAEASLTPQPLAFPLDLVLEWGSPPPPVGATTEFHGWIRAKVELQVFSSPQLDATPVGVLAAGELAAASEDANPVAKGWVRVDRPNASGWVAIRQGGADLVERYAPPPGTETGSILKVADGPDGFVGIGQPSGTSAAGPRPPAILIHSADGADWKVAGYSPAPGLYPMDAAWGPAGWLLVSSGTDGSTWISTSPDGSQWTVAGTLRTQGGSLYPLGLAATDAGYLFRSEGYGPGARQALWLSANGIDWHEVDPGLTSTYSLVAGAAGGFYAWTDPAACCPRDCCPDQAARSHQAAFSADGVTWSPVVGGPQDPGLQLAAIGERWFGIETDSATGAPRPWLGRVTAGQLSWQSMPGSLAPFENATVSSLVSTGEEVLAFGWDPATEAPLTWTIIGPEWSRSVLPSGFSGVPRLAAAGRAGVALVGYRQSILGVDPVVWHRSPSGAWLPEPDPLIGPVRELSAADCAPLPADALAFVLLDQALAPFCYGDAAMTFRAWSGPCDSCRGAGEGTYEPAWLAAPADNQLALGPTEWEGAWMQRVVPRAVVAPTLALVPAKEWLGVWLEVTGHFDDPLAETCRFTPSRVELESYAGTIWDVNNCRHQFVVTAVRVVDGP